jgi:hypothetical protein
MDYNWFVGVEFEYEGETVNFYIPTYNLWGLKDLYEHPETYEAHMFFYPKLDEHITIIGRVKNFSQKPDRKIFKKEQYKIGNIINGKSYLISFYAFIKLS